MNILHVVQAYYPFQERGGPVFKVRALAGNLARRGHKVTVLTADLGLKEYPKVGKLKKYAWGSGLELDGLEVIYLSTLANYRALTINLGLRSFCESEMKVFDVVHFFGLYDLLAPVASYRCRKLSIPYVSEPMGMYHPIDRSLRLKRLWHRHLGSAFLRNAASLIATSDLERGKLLEAGFAPEKVAVRLNGVDSELFSGLPSRGTFRAKWNVSPNEPLVVFLSRLIPRKGADILIGAFAKARLTNGRLVMAGPEGEPGYRAYLEKCAKDAGLESRVLFTGPLYGYEKQALYADADLFALPSRYENFANVAAEAMACGVPVVVGEGCGIRSLVEGRAGLVVAPEKDELSEAIRALLCDESLRAQFRRGCRLVSEQLDWGTLTEQMEGHYKNAIARQEKMC